MSPFVSLRYVLLSLCVSCAPLTKEGTSDPTPSSVEDDGVGDVETDVPGESAVTSDCDGPDLCNGVDDDCDGAVDEDAELFTWYVDDDGDGVGGEALEACAQPDGTVAETDGFTGTRD